MNLKRAKELAAEAGLAITPMRDFGDGTKGFFVGSVKVFIDKRAGAACWTYEGAPTKPGWLYPRGSDPVRGLVPEKDLIGNTVAKVVANQRKLVEVST